MTVDIWQDLRAALSSSTAALLPLPEGAQAEANLFSMANYAPLIDPLLDALAPTHVCEIGIDLGDNTRMLLARLGASGGRLTVVDPIAALPSDLTARPNVSHARALSVDFLDAPNDVDVYFVDGDHNYETVSRELALIERHRDPARPLCLFMHDTSWPCARRDQYYDPSVLAAPHPHVDGTFGITPYAPGAAEGTGFGLERQFDWAREEGGSRNGVLTALEEFLAGSAGSAWRGVSIPSLYGLTVLWTPDALTPAQGTVFEAFAARMDAMRPFLMTLELNRLVLLTRVFDAGAEWKRQRAHIETLEEVATRSLWRHAAALLRKRLRQRKAA